MPPTIEELMRALPDVESGEPARIGEPLAAAALRQVPVGRWRRLRLLGTLQAKIGAAYLFYWIRGWFKKAEAKQRRLSKDWEYVKNQFDDLRRRLEQETDYEAEAATLAKVRSLFRDDEGIVVPRVYPQYSTARILTMERLGGVHLDEFLARHPSQEERNEFARKIIKAWYRMFYAGRLLYSDFHPGNFLFMEDGRLGVIDFGFMLPFDEELWQLMRLMDRAFTTGRREDRIAAVKAWAWITDDPAEADYLRLTEEFCDWEMRARYCGEPFDFADEADFRQGIDLFSELLRKRYSKTRPCTPVIMRQHMGWRSLLYRLKAKIDVRSLAEEEVKATGWDRSDYA